MKSFVSLLAGSALLATAALFPASGHAAPARAAAPAMSVSIVSVNPTMVTAKHATVTFRLSIKGLVLDAAHMGKANIQGHGHIQLYVDKIAPDAYSKKDLKQHWLAALSATTLSLNLPPMLIGGPGKHKIIVALAQNDYVLYRTPTASITITAK